MAVSEEETLQKSAHVADEALAPFLHSDFDPADYLNAALPSLSLSSVSSRPLKSGNAVSLANLSTQTQDLLSLLNAHTTRLSAILTQLTDDILRSGGRLAYQVEVLRGETIGLTETLTDGLRDDIARFVPSGMSLNVQQTDDDTAIPQEELDDNTPEHVSDLRTLTTVRSRLETVVKVFGEAMHWTIPPSEVSLGASLISVSAPEPGADSASREQKGKEFAMTLRAEIADLITGDLDSGVEKAEARIQALRDLTHVWKGTAEEKARTRFVDSLVKLAEDKQREIEREKEKAKEKDQKSGRGNSLSKPAQQTQQQRSGGFLENLLR